MKSSLLFIAILTMATSIGQNAYEPNEQYPFGRPHPDAPEQSKDWHELIGICDCVSEARNADQTWAAPQKMTWKFKYILNGNGVQDQTIKDDGG